jgi:hypothetical protein
MSIYQYVYKDVSHGHKYIYAQIVTHVDVYVYVYRCIYMHVCID